MTETFALVLIALVMPWLTEFLKRYPTLEVHRYWLAMVVAFLLTFVASLLSAETLPWDDPQGFVKNITLIFTVAGLIYRYIIKDQPKVQDFIRMKR